MNFISNITGTGFYNLVTIPIHVTSSIRLCWNKTGLLWKKKPNVLPCR